MKSTASTALGPDDFVLFFKALHGHEPFDWQQALARCVLGAFAEDEEPHDGVDNRGWPGTIEMPTATGKTAVLDIAVFAMAADSAQPRRAPRRCFFVVDRRVVVDSAYERACHIARALAVASHGVLSRVADRLRALSGTDTPLATAILRGGMYREDNWACTPSQALLAVSTVDQVGSRLLGRGYGVGDRMKPIHMGLLANDSLIILDEAHISAPFEDTLTAIDTLRSWAESEIATPYQVVRMSATLAGEAEFSLGRVEDEQGVDGRLEPRLKAHKRTRLQLVEMETPPKKKDDRATWRRFYQGRPERDETFAKACVEAVRDLLKDSRSRVGVVLSRVGLARRAFEALQQDDDADVMLLTGRIRPLDRDRILDEILPILHPGASVMCDRPLVVVATQCIEVGADLDFDALVTDCASLDALKQRFGRLDRIGSREETPAVIIARQDIIDTKAEPDPVYGDAPRETWDWLQRVAEKKGRGRHAVHVIDFGARAFSEKERSLSAEAKRKLLAPRRNAPLLLPAYLDAWAQTAPKPAVEPEVALWLHGRPEGGADVQIVWRADLAVDNSDLWARIVSLCPPASMEALPVPLYAARAWLARTPAEDVPDVEAVAAEDLADRIDATAVRAPARPFLRWRGDETDETQVVRDPQDLRPGDTIVVPASYGGTDRFGWQADANGVVEDLGDEAQWKQRGRAILRLHDGVVARWLASIAAEGSATNRPPLPSWPDVQVEESDQRERIDEFLCWITSETSLPDWVRGAAHVLFDDPHRSVTPYPDGQGVVLRGSRRVPLIDDSADRSSEFTSEDDSSSFTTAISLSRHCGGVEDLARRFAERCGLRRELVEDMALAGWLHDVGKADPRFQVMLHGGDEVAEALAAEPWAKSGMQGRDERERARRAAGYPKGERHELLSLAMIQNCEEVASRAHDPDLVLHLVASHHGYCRPFAPVQSDEEVDVFLKHGDWKLVASTPTGAARLDSGVPARFWRLLRRYGWFGLPYLEAILRLADHRQSEHEESRGPAPGNRNGGGR